MDLMTIFFLIYPFIFYAGDTAVSRMANSRRRQELYLFSTWDSAPMIICCVTDSTNKPTPVLTELYGCSVGGAGGMGTEAVVRAIFCSFV